MKINDFGTMPQVEVMPQAHEVEILNENQFFDFEKQKVQVLTLDKLKRTVKENRGDDRTCPHGIYHFMLVQKILDMCAEQGYNAEVYDLFATNNRDKQTPGVSLNPEIEAQYGERAVEAHTLRRIYANIRLKDFDTDEVTTNMAVAYTQKGIQIAFGRNVKVCHNQTILGSGQFISDYQCRADSPKTTLEGMMTVVSGWLTNAQNIVIKDDETIERMKNSVLTAEQIYTILGMLMSIRVAHDTAVKKIRYSGETYPLNQAQLSKFTENLLVKQKDEGQITAWSFYNAATDLYKPETAETNMINLQNMALVDFMRQQEIF